MAGYPDAVTGEPRAVGDADVDRPLGEAAGLRSPQPQGAALPDSGEGAGGAPPPPAGPDGDEPGVGDGPARSGGSFLRELPVLIVIALLLALLIKAFLVQAFFIPSGSMEQTLQIGDRVLVNKLVYRFRDIQRGEIVVFDGRTSSFQPEVLLPEPGNPLERVVRGVQGVLGLGAAGERDFIKRVVGLPGDEVMCCDEQGRVSVNGESLDEPYLYEDDHRTFGPVLVPERRIFVLGDHRGASQDSRAYLANPDVGTVALDRVIGRAFVVVWPPPQAQVLERPDTFDTVPAAAAPALVPVGPASGAALAAAPLLLGAAGAVPARAGARRAVRAVLTAGAGRAAGRRSRP